MAEKRSTTDEAAAAVPKARAEEADPAPTTERVTSSDPASTEPSAPNAPKATAPRKRSAPRKSTTPTKSSAPRKRSTPRTAADGEAPPKATKSTAPAGAADASATSKPPVKKTVKKVAKKSVKPAVPAPLREPATIAPTSPAPALAPAMSPATSVPGAWAAAAWQAVQDPGQPPRRLAELAVAELGPRAAAWAGWLRATYPDAPAHGLARLAAHEAGRFGWPLALAGVGGPVAAAMSLPVAAGVRASVVLRVAAAYGYDPTDPGRVDDLLELLGLVEPAGSTKPNLGRLTGLAGRIGLTRFAISRLGLRRTPAAKAVRVLTGAADHHESIERLAHRAARRYRPKSH